MKTLKLFLIATLLTAGTLAAGQPVDETRPASPDARIEISNLAGSVEVTGWNRSEVHVSGELGDDTEGLEIQTEGDTLTIEVKIPQGRHEGERDLASHLTVQVPQGCRLEVDTVSAGITVADLTNRVELQSVSGAQTVEGSLEEVELQTVSGVVELRATTRRAEINAVSGAVTVGDATGELTVQTVSSHMQVAARDLERGELQTVSGKIDFSGDLAATGRLEVNSHSGRAVLALPAGISARFDVQTFSGDIVNELSAEAPASSHPGKQLSFTTGSGGAHVSVNSFSGEVILKAR